MRVVALLMLSLICLLAAPVAHAQDWARKMFTETSHDLGTVAHGAKTEYRFQFKNLYVEDLHIASIRSSCGCTTPTLVFPGESQSQNGLTLKTYETGEVLATFNTHLMTGYKSATLTLTIDRPFSAEVQLQVRGQILTEIAVNPNFVNLATVNQGQPAEKTVSITRTGRRDWKINDVRCANTNFEVEVLEKSRTLSSVTYDLKVRLKNSAPAGAINDQLVLVTNDDRMPQFPIQVQGEVKPEISVTPSLWMAGSLNPGNEIKKALVIRNNSQKPFKILNIISDDQAITFRPLDPSAPAKATYVVPLTLIAPNEPGRQSKKIRIETDAGAVVPEMTVTYLVKGTPLAKPEANLTGDQNDGASGVKTEFKVGKPATGSIAPGTRSSLDATNSVKISGQPSAIRTDKLNLTVPAVTTHAATIPPGETGAEVQSNQSQLNNPQAIASQKSLVESNLDSRPIPPQRRNILRPRSGSGK